MPLSKILDGGVYSSRKMDKTSHQRSCRNRNWKTLLVIWARNLRKRLPVSFAKVRCYQVPSRVWETESHLQFWLVVVLVTSSRSQGSELDARHVTSTLHSTLKYITRDILLDHKETCCRHPSQQGLERSLGMD